jgi:hypothetical protein
MESGFILLLVLVVPFIIFWPALVWAGAIKGLYLLAREKAKARAVAH